MEPRVLQHDDQGEGDPIVLVPGGLTGWLSWIPHQERLAAERRAIRVQPVHNELGSRGELVDPGYDDEVERECLRVLLRGSRPTVWCPARGLGPRALSPGYLRAIAEGHLVVLTPFTRSQRPAAHSARLRNLLVASVAPTLVVIHAVAGGSVERCCRSALSWGRRVLTLDSPHNRGLLAMGAAPFCTSDLRNTRAAAAHAA